VDTVDVMDLMDVIDAMDPPQRAFGRVDEEQW